MRLFFPPVVMVGFVMVFVFLFLQDRFTPTRHRMIVRYKTAYYTFYLPCAIGMIYAGVKDAPSYRLARDICCRIGEFFQIQDDFLDCFGDPEVIGKVSQAHTACGWFVLCCFVLCSVRGSDQRIQTRLD